MTRVDSSGFNAVASLGFPAGHVFAAMLFGTLGHGIALSYGGVVIAFTVVVSGLPLFKERTSGATEWAAMALSMTRSPQPAPSRKPL